MYIDTFYRGRCIWVLQTLLHYFLLFVSCQIFFYKWRLKYKLELTTFAAKMKALNAKYFMFHLCFLLIRFYTQMLLYFIVYTFLCILFLFYLFTLFYLPLPFKTLQATCMFSFPSQLHTSYGQHAYDFCCAIATYLCTFCFLALHLFRFYCQYFTLFICLRALLCILFFFISSLNYLPA